MHKVEQHLQHWLKNLQIITERIVKYNILLCFTK